jgi:CBS-domain-containing membrane protein
MAASNLASSFQIPDQDVAPISHTLLVQTHARNLLISRFLIYTKTSWLESASELYRPSDRSLSEKLVPTFADRGCHVVRVTDPHGRILGSLDRSRYCSFQVAPQLYSRV